MKITEKELLERVSPRVGGELRTFASEAPVSSQAFRERALVIETARALGYEVVEEPELPELPEQLYVGRSMRGEPPAASLLWVKGRGEDTWPVLARFELSNTPPGFPEELVRRYNAKTAVLRVVKRIENGVAVWENQLPHAPGVAKDLREYARLLRAAYEAGDE